MAATVQDVMDKIHGLPVDMPVKIQVRVDGVVYNVEIDSHDVCVIGDQGETFLVLPTVWLNRTDHITRSKN